MATGRHGHADVVHVQGQESHPVQIVFPYIAEENSDEDPEVQVKPQTDTAAARKAKDAIYADRKKV